jgi:Tol biopolymer transport system component
MKWGAVAIVISASFVLLGAAESRRPPALLTFSSGEPLVAPAGLCIARGDGTKSARLLKVRRDDRESAWSPGGKYVAFVRYRSRPAPGAITQIYLATSRGRVIRNLTRTVSGVQAFNVHPSWSPDGRKIAFEAAWRGSGIYVIDRKGSRLTWTGIFGGDPQWAPDGNTIIVTKEVGYPEYDDLYSADLTRGDEKLLLEDAREPALSPDGTQIAFIRGLELWLAASDGANPRPLVRSTTELLGNPAWSPDGSRIAFDRAPTITSARKSVVIVDSTTGGEISVIKGRGGAYAPSWRPAVVFPRAPRRAC